MVHAVQGQEAVTDEQIEHCARELCDEWYRAHVETTQLTWRNRSEADKVAFRQLARRVIADQMSDGARVLALLKRIEWADEGQFCPACSKLLPGGNPEPGEGHEPDCELAALIRELSA